MSDPEGRPSLAALGRFGNVGFVAVEIPHLRALLDIAEAALAYQRESRIGERQVDARRALFAALAKVAR